MIEKIATRLPIDWITIQSDDPRIVRQSRLLQLLIVLVTFAGFSGAITSFISLRSDPTQSQSIDLLITGGQGMVILVFSTVTFYLLHHGRFLIALHIFLIALNTIFFTLLVTTSNDIVFSYLLLISVFTIAALQSNFASFVYFALITAGMAVFYNLTSPEEVFSNLSVFLRVSLFLCAPIWFFGNDLRRSRDRNQKLARELEKTVDTLDSQAKQLAQIAEIGRVATASLDSKQLLTNVVDLIQKRFNFYYVSVLLISPDGTRLILEEASGETGHPLKEGGHHLTMGQVSIVGWVAINRQARIALDVGEDPYFFNNPNLPDTRSEVALPLIARGRLLGVLDVQSREVNAFKEEDLSALQVMADQIASGLGNARLFNEISAQASTLTELQSVTNLMNQQANTRNALNVLANKLPPIFDADGGGVFLYDTENDHLTLAVNLNPADTRPGPPLKPGQGLAGWVFQENKSHAVDDYSTWAGRDENYVQIGFHAALAIPLRRQNDPIGVLALTRSQKGQSFKPEEIQIAELLAAQISAVIINNQLIEETRRLAQREMAINQATAQIRRSLDAKTILDTTTAELGTMFHNKIIRARLFDQEPDPAEEQIQ